MPTTYKVFKRSATNWEEFFRARKITIDCKLSYEEALRCCERFNQSRTPAQIRRGTKYEFEREGR